MVVSDGIGIGPRPPELRHLRCFVAVADTLHFGRAAERIGMAQPPLSQQIARLEVTVGHPLFTRSRSGPARVALTEAGQALLPLARRLLADAERALDAARAAGRGERGVVRVAFVASLAATILPAALRDYRAAQPDVALSLREMTTAPMLKALAAGEVDVGLGREVEPSDAIRTVELIREPLMLAAPNDFALSATGPARLSDLADALFVLPPRDAGPGFHDRIVGACVAAGFAPQIVQEAIEWRTVLALVEAGFGVTLAPASALRTVPTSLVVRNLATVVTTTVGACWRSDEEAPARALLVSWLIEAFARISRS